MKWLANLRRRSADAQRLERIAASTFTLKVNGENIIGPMTLENLWMVTKYGGETGSAMWVESGLVEVRVEGQWS